MKLLFGEKMSRRLVAELADVFPRFAQVRAVGLDRATDATIWTLALAHDPPSSRRIQTFTR